MNRKEMKKLLFQLALSDTDYIDTLEKIREAITPYMDYWHPLSYMPNDDDTINEILHVTDCSYCELLGWAVADGYKANDDYIKCSSMYTVSAEELRKLYVNNTSAIIQINEIIESSTVEKIDDLESIMKKIEEEVDII